MIKVKVENYQSIANADITIEGFTVVTGKNNSGKSALLRSINSVFTNALGSSFVRHGEDSCSVELDFGSGSTVKWSKGSKVKPTYWINGGDPIFCGRNAPLELEQFGVLPLKVGTREIWPQIAPQFSGQIFLIDLPGSVLAEVVADVDRVGELNTALKNCEKDKRSHRSKLKVRLEDLLNLQKERETYDNLEEEVEVYEKLEKERLRISLLAGRIHKLKSLRDRYQRSSLEIKRLNGVGELKTQVEKLELEVDVLSAKRTQISKYIRVSRRYLRYSKACLSLRGVTDLEVPKSGKIKEIRASLKLYKRLGTSYKNSSEIIQSLKVVQTLALPETDNVVSLMKRLKELRGLRNRRDLHSERVTRLEGVSNFEMGDASEPTSKRLKELILLRRLLRVAQNAVSKVESSIEDSKEKLLHVENEISDTLQDHGECPYCGEET